MEPPLPIKGYDLSAEDFLLCIRQAVHRACRSYRYAPNTDDVNEISQRVFFHLAQNDFRLLRSFDNQKGTLNSWLKTIAKHELGDYLQDRGSIQSLEDIDPDSFVSSPSQENNLYLTECLTLLLSLVEKSSLRQQEIAALLRRDDISDQERSELMGLKPSAFRTLKCQTIKKLRQLVEMPDGRKPPMLSRKNRKSQ